MWWCVVTLLPDLCLGAMRASRKCVALAPELAQSVEEANLLTAKRSNLFFAFAFPTLLLSALIFFTLASLNMEAIYEHSNRSSL